MSLEENIKKWVVLDNSHKKLCEQVKSVRDEKNKLHENIITYLDANNISNPIINISDGKLNISETKTANVLTYKFLAECLHEYFDKTTEADELMEFIKNKRTFITSKSIKRFYNK